MTQRWRILNRAIPGSIEDVLGLLMENRKVEPVTFLHNGLGDLRHYLGILNLDRAAARLAHHLAKRHRIVLVGDYDCDGICSATLMSLFLHDIGFSNFDVVIPTREEGYGIPQRALEHHDPQLMLAMDCGTTDHQAVRDARDRGVEVVVVDHHEVQDQVPSQALLVNPKQPGCRSPFKELCSAGLTLLFLTRLRNHLRDAFPRPKLDGRYLATAALATVADIVPLVEANRIIVQAGLRAIRDRPPLAFRQLQSISGTTRHPVTARDLSFQFAPRINAAGRMTDPLLAYDFMIAREERYAAMLADQLEAWNRKRQRMEQAAFDQIQGLLAEPGVVERPGRTLVLAGEGWHPGLVGILASRVQRHLHYGPVIVLTIDPENGAMTGSARSIEGFDLQLALASCEDLLLRWGGHKMAAGLALQENRLEPFRERFEAVARKLPDDLFTPVGRIDLELKLDLAGEALFEALQALEPHGAGNPVPVFVARNRSVRIERVFGRATNHLSLVIDDTIPAVFWNGIHRHNGGPPGRQMVADVIFQMDWDDYHRRPRLKVQALAPTDQHYL